MTRYPRTKTQRAFRREYQSQTGFEFLDDTREPFVDVAHSQIKWFRDMANNACQRLERELAKFEKEQVTP